MTAKPTAPMARVRPHFPSLKTLGVAVEYFANYRNEQIALHAVDVVLFSVALRGRARHFIDHDEFDMRPGSVGITSFGQKHDVVTTARGMEKFNVYLDPAVFSLPQLPSPLNDLLTTMLQTARAFKNRLNRGFQFSVANVTTLRQTLERIQSELHDRRPGYGDVVRARLTEFLVDCCRGAHESGLIRSEPQHEVFPAWTRSVQTLLDTRYAEPWSLEELAGRFGISVGHLCRTYRAYAGKTVTDYLIDRRVQAAMRELEAGTTKLLKVALTHGFSDYSYFHRQFRKRTGQTPSGFRRQHQKAV